MQGYLDAAGIAKRLNVKVETVYAYKARARRAKAGDVVMPDPVGKMGNSPIWDEKDIEAWDAQRRGRGWRKGLKGTARSTAEHS